MGSREVRASIFLPVKEKDLRCHLFDDYFIELLGSSTHAECCD